MTTDKTPATLATVKHGGCVQLGDGLLPCPFCGERAERIDFGPGSGDNEGGSCVACTVCQHSGPVEFGYKENFISNWNRRARSAQPSPGGQDALADAARRVLSDVDSGDYHGEISEATYAALEAALAARQPVRSVKADEAPFGLTTAEKVAWARGANDAIKEYVTSQPVGENPAWRDELVREAYNRGLADGLNADRQPAGEPVAFRVHYLSGKTGEVIETGKWCDAPVPSFIDESVTLFCGNTQRLELAYAAPPAQQPAQAVDLGQFREAVVYQRSTFMAYGPYTNNPEYSRVINKCDHLLALIDSRAVGK